MKSNDVGKFLRGIAMVIAGIIMLLSPVSCRKEGNVKVPENISQTVYSDLNYTVIQGNAVRKPGETNDKEYVFIPLTFQNNSDVNIIFSSEVCIRAFAEPSGDECKHAGTSAVAAAKESIADFVLFDGIIHGKESADGWLVFEVPIKTESVKVDFYTGYASDEYISFTCSL